MQRLNGYLFYQLGYQLRPLETIEKGKKLGDVSSAIYYAKLWLDWFLADKVIPITFSKETGYALSAALAKLVPDQLTEVPPERLEYELSWQDAYAITSSLKEFQIVWQTELGKMDTYFISQKGIYSTSDLIERADNVLPKEIADALPESIRSDIKQAGRCLAFDLATATGFHIMRALEGVLRDFYCPAFLDKKPRGRNWNSYIQCLRDTDADPRILAILDQIRSLHRNPTIHPQEVLTINEAMTLFGIAQSAIVAMVGDAADL
ncbi:MAG: hypothetical protein HY665_09930 [Chloroflexi bacterium]|nr:hypothetical protein [Chloroflexota bacterium]